MTVPEDPTEAMWSYSAQHRVDLVCDQFEKAWQAGNRPSIRQVAEENSQAPRQLLLLELIKLEIYFKTQAGDKPTLSEYLNQFPEDLGIVDEAWKAMRGPTGELPGTVNPRLSTTVKSAKTEPINVTSSLGRYQILRELGKGGFGTVYLANCEEYGQVALKVANRSVVEEEEQRKRVLDEARVGKSLGHPNLVQTFDAEEIDGHVVIVQQYVDGVDLGEWHKQQKPSQVELGRIFIPIAQALSHLHEQLYVHRDVKPANILMDRDGRPFVTDFGLALHEDVQRRHRWELGGTWPYMSPEQIRRKSHLVDGQSDIWSIGVILYRFLTGRFPFGGPIPPRHSDEFSQYLQDLESEITEHDPKPPRMIQPSISRRLEKVCLRCLEKRKRDRYPTALDLAEDLQLFIERKATTVGTSSQTAKRVVPKGLHSFGASDAEFFADLLPGPRNSQGIPASLNFWRNQLARQEAESPLDIGVIYGPSGCGKSSFVRAGLLPLLGDDCRPVVVDATARDTEVRLIKGLRQTHPNLPESDSLVELCSRLSGERQTGNTRTLIVLDQFEQWLQANTSYDSTQLAAALQHCDGLHLQALVLVRDDFWMPLTRFMDVLEVTLQENRNIAAVDLFDDRHAIKVLTEFGRAYGRLSQEELTASEQEFLKAAVDELHTGERTICVRLSLFAEMMKNRPWTSQELLAVGGAKGVGQTFLEQSFGSQAPIIYRRHASAAQRLLGFLLPPYGSEIKGQMRSEEELFDASELTSRKEYEQLIAVLNTDLKLVTPVSSDSPEGKPDNDASSGRFYQLTHDYLVPSIREFLSSELRRTPAGRAQLTLKERSEDWERHPDDRHLPSFVEWLNIRRHLRTSSWSELQQKMMRRLDWIFALRSGVAISVVVVALLVVGTVFMKSRADSLVKEVLNADTSELEQVANRVRDLSWWVQPGLRNAFSQEFSGGIPSDTEDESALRRWLHLSLTIDDSLRNERLEQVVENLSRVPAQNLDTVAKMLVDSSHTDPATAEQFDAWRTQAESLTGYDLLPRAALLANTPKGQDFFEQHASAIVEQLRDTKSTNFPYWLDLLEGQGAVLVTPLLDRLAQTPVSEGVRRSQVVNALARYARNDAKALIAAIEIAEPEEFEVLVPPLRKVAKPEDWVVPEAPEFDSAQYPELHLALQEFDGLLTNRGGFALAVPHPETAKLIQLADPAGFRPISIRPYQTEQALFTVIVFAYDNREYKFADMVSQEELEALNKQYAASDFHIVDFAINKPDQGLDLRWWAVWEETRDGDPETLLDISIPQESKLRSEYVRAREREGLVWTKFAKEVDSTGTPIRAAVWQRLNGPQIESDTNEIYLPPPQESKYKLAKAEFFGDYRPGKRQTDLRHHGTTTLGLYFEEQSTMKSKTLLQETGNELYGHLRDAALNIFRPELIEPAQNEDGKLVFSSVWTSPITATTALSQSRAKRVLAAAHCAQENLLQVLALDEGADRDAYSFAIEYLSRTGLKPDFLTRVLEVNQVPSSQRFALLAAGVFPETELSAEFTDIVDQLATSSPDAGVCSAARWCLAQWRFERASINKNSDRANYASPQSNSERNGPVNANWRTNRIGTMMIRIQPSDFLMGSPVYEQGRINSEQLNWMHIPRVFELAATHVTVANFRRFVNDSTVRDRLPKDMLDTLDERVKLDETTWSVHCPQTAMPRLYAMLFCEWLSELEGIPMENRCYPDIWEYVQQMHTDDWSPSVKDEKYGYQPPSNVLSRTGYRLPTDAEMEFACRAGSSLSRHYGDSEYLLDAYSWYDANSENRPWPVGLKKPNSFGFFDMYGNVSQHCQNLSIPYETPINKGIRVDEMPLENESGYYNLRGGDYSSPAADMRSAKRYLSSHSNNRIGQGFRICRTLELTE